MKYRVVPITCEPLTEGRYEFALVDPTGRIKHRSWSKHPMTKLAAELNEAYELGVEYGRGVRAVVESTVQELQVGDVFHRRGERREITRLRRGSVLFRNPNDHDETGVDSLEGFMEWAGLEATIGFAHKNPF